jgi:hypothetical protein
MSLERKIIASFLISAGLVAALALAGAFTFVDIRREIIALELSDTLRSRTLLVRRHEKNFFLYGELKDARSLPLPRRAGRHPARRAGARARGRRGPGAGVLGTGAIQSIERRAGPRRMAGLEARAPPPGIRPAGRGGCSSARS